MSCGMEGVFVSVMVFCDEDGVLDNFVREEGLGGRYVCVLMLCL